MSTSAVLLALAVFGASAVEMVEALTIVVAAGTTRGWRSALEGSAVAVIVLCALVGGIGVPLVHLVPISILRVVIGGLLLVLGLSWMRKAILRASGHKALHDEDAIFAKTVTTLSNGLEGNGVTSATQLDRPRRFARLAGQRDATGFVVAFKGVFLEGMEVVLIVLSLGSSSHRLGLAAASAALAVIIVGGVGVVVARQLSEVPENLMKMAVGVMLTSFGVFWVGEGAGVAWPGSDVAILGLIVIFVVVTKVGILIMRNLLPKEANSQVAPSHFKGDGADTDHLKQAESIDDNIESGGR